MDALDHQEKALKKIVDRARTFYAGTWRGLTIQPRCSSLTVAPTGVGKTTIAFIAAECVGAKTLRISAPGWMPAGAHQRGTKETISVIAGAVAANDRTLLVIDEICKIAGAENPWLNYVRGEILDLTDGRWPTGLNLSEINDESEAHDVTIDELTVKLRETVFILGIGTFQVFFDSANARRTIGFDRNNKAERDELSAEIIAGMLPRELANRFNSDLIQIPELRAEDYHRIARKVEESLPKTMRRLFREQVGLKIDGAIESKKGVRFLEEAVMAVLVVLPTDKPEPGPIPNIL